MEHDRYTVFRKEHFAWTIIRLEQFHDVSSDQRLTIDRSFYGAAGETRNTTSGKRKLAVITGAISISPDVEQRGWLRDKEKNAKEIAFLL